MALSVSLTAVSNLLAATTLPALSLLAADHFLGTKLESVEFGDLTLRVVAIVTVNVLLGMEISNLVPRLIKRYEPSIFSICFAVFIVIINLSFVEEADTLLSGLILLGWQLALLTSILLALGFAMGKVGGWTPPQPSKLKKADTVDYTLPAMLPSK